MSSATTTVDGTPNDVCVPWSRLNLLCFFATTADQGALSLLNPYLKTQLTLDKCAVVRLAPSWRSSKLDVHTRRQ